jgi:hypothetical protein
MGTPERMEYVNDKRSQLRGEGRIKQDYNQTNQQVCGKPPEDPTDRDWMEYHNKIKKMKKDTIGGYQDYYDIDDEDEHNPYQ